MGTTVTQWFLREWKKIKMNEQYSVISKYYELLNSGVDYEAFADFLKAIIDRYGIEKTELVLDLACGTGKITRLLADRGYDMTGIDISPDMLMVARDREIAEPKGILYLCQDMREFELYGTVDACVCCLDSINYLLKNADVEKCFSLVHNYLVPNGIFVFDVNTPYRFVQGYAKHDYVMEEEGVLLAWQNYYNEKSNICEFVLSLFCENEDGSYERYDEEQKEKMYSRTTLERLLKKTGFEIIDVYSDYDFSVISDNSDKWFFVCRCIK